MIYFFVLLFVLLANLPAHGSHTDIMQLQICQHNFTRPTQLVNVFALRTQCTLTGHLPDHVPPMFYSTDVVNKVASFGAVKDVLGYNLAQE